MIIEEIGQKGGGKMRLGFISVLILLIKHFKRKVPELEILELFLNH